MSFYSTNSAVQDVQLKVQELVTTLADNQIVSTSGSTATVNCGQTLTEVRCALFIDDSAGTCAPVQASNRTVSGQFVTLTLSAPLAANDAIIVEFVVAE